MDIMKTKLLILLFGFAALLAPTAHAQDNQNKKMNAVFQVTSADAQVWDHVLNHVENLREALGKENVGIEVVAHSAGLDMLVGNRTGKSVDRMRTLSQAGVVFAACENTMKKQKVTRADLFPFVTTVDSGVAEIVRKQQQGWSYLKE